MVIQRSLAVPAALVATFSVALPPASVYAQEPAKTEPAKEKKTVDDYVEANRKESVHKYLAEVFTKDKDVPKEQALQLVATWAYGQEAQASQAAWLEYGKAEIKAKSAEALWKKDTSNKETLEAAMDAGSAADRARTERGKITGKHSGAFGNEAKGYGVEWFSKKLDPETKALVATFLEARLEEVRATLSKEGLPSMVDAPEALKKWAKFYADNTIDVEYLKLYKFCGGQKEFKPIKDLVDAEKKRKEDEKKKKEDEKKKGINSGNGDLPQSINIKSERQLNLIDFTPSSGPSASSDLFSGISMRVSGSFGKGF